MRSRRFQLRKEASALSPEALYFFRDEMQKEAILTPRSALKAMGYAKPGMFGNAVRKAGQLGLDTQMVAAKYAPTLTNAAATGSTIPAIAGIAAGGIAKATRFGSKAPVLSSLSELAANFV
jgi:hypothetical protein